MGLFEGLIFSNPSGSSLLDFFEGFFVVSCGSFSITRSLAERISFSFSFDSIIF